MLQHTCTIACSNLLICDFAKNTNVLGSLIILIRLNLLWFCFVNYKQQWRIKIEIFIFVRFKELILILILMFITRLLVTVNYKLIEFCNEQWFRFSKIIYIRDVVSWFS